MKKLAFYCGAVAICALLVLCADSVQACTTASPSITGMVKRAEVIVRATAFSKVEGDIEFRIAEVLKGDNSLQTLIIGGYFIDEDNFNQSPAPYREMRSSGGLCHNNTYKPGAEYLLFLTTKEGQLTPYWYSLAPVNEQLHPADDAWLAWVRSYLQELKQDGSGDNKEHAAGETELPI